MDLTNKKKIKKILGLIPWLVKFVEVSAVYVVSYSNGQRSSVFRRKRFFSLFIYLFSFCFFPSDGQINSIK